MLHLHSVSNQQQPASEKDRIRAVREVLEKTYHDWSAEDRKFCDDEAIQRYLKARKGDVPHAAKQLLSTVKWRKEFDVGGLDEAEFDHELAAGRMYIAGHDSEGHPVLLSRKRNDRQDPTQLDYYVRYLVFTLESVVQSMHNDRHQWVWLMDLRNYSSANSPPLKSTIQFLSIFMEHYPERLFKMYVVDAPTIAWVLFKAISPFLDPQTKAKIVFVYTKDMPPHGNNPADAPHPLQPDQARFCKEYLPMLRSGYSEHAYRELLAKAHGSKRMDDSAAGHVHGKGDITLEDIALRKDSASSQMVGLKINCGPDSD